MHRLLSSLASDFGIRFKKRLGYDKDQTSDPVWKRSRVGPRVDPDLCFAPFPCSAFIL